MNSSTSAKPTILALASGKADYKTQNSTFNIALRAVAGSGFALRRLRPIGTHSLLRAVAGSGFAPQAQAYSIIPTNLISYS